MSDVHASSTHDGAPGERQPPSPLAARLLPYGFAKSGQVLIAHQLDDTLEVWISERTSDAALAEIARNFGSISVHRVPADELATLHTNDAASAVTRLTDMGVEPYLLASSLLGVLAQRLVRQLCPVCKEERQEEGRTVWHPVGCDKCGHSGYSGRRGVYELLLVDESIRSLIHRNAADAEILAAGRAEGMRTLRDDAERWLASGATSLEEVLRVTGGA